MYRLDFSGQLVGPYILTNLIGSGASGNVYRAVVGSESSTYPATFAIKCLPKKVSRRRWAQLIAEMVNHDAATGCSHVLPLRNIIEEDLYLFIVLDLCEMDMYKAIWKTKVYWRNDALIKKAFLEVVDGVIACHRKGIYHRDLKPENIMCRADGMGIQIGDFGLATTHRLCRDGGRGTPYYMSPECWASDERNPYYGEFTDVWSLGLILFNMVTSRYPWQVALASDTEFKAFLDDEDHLFRTSPISEQLSSLLKWILHPTPMRRLSIPVIRKLVLEMDTFYKWRRPVPDTSPLSEMH